MRYALIKTLIREAQQNDRLWLLTGDVGHTVLEPFAHAYPTRYINVGVAEQNMVGIAAGLAMEGNSVCVYTMASFLTRRAYEQIRNDIAGHMLPVVIVGTGAGFFYGHAGPSHLAVEDIALMRTIPGMTIMTPADPIETVWATKAAIRLRAPVYVRLGKSGEPTIYTKKQRFKIGKGTTIRKGREVAIITCGVIASEVLTAARSLVKRNIHPTIVSMPTIKPIDEACIQSLGKTYRLIITVEEHSIIGGLGSVVAEVIARSHVPAHLMTLGIADTYISTIGSQAFLRETFGLTSENIAYRIHTGLEKIP